MTTTRWKQVEELFEQAVRLPANDRDAFLDRACDGDAALRADVLSLLTHDAHADTEFLEPVVAAPSFDLDIDTDDALLGETVGDCMLLRVLGTGGMAGTGAFRRPAREPDDHEDAPRNS